MLPIAPFASPITGGTNYKNITESTAVATGEGSLIGVFCASSSAATLKVWDSTAASGSVIVNTFTMYSGTWYPLPFKFRTGLYLTVSGTADITASFS